MSPGCDKEVRFNTNTLRYLKYCSSSCGFKDPRTMEKRRLNELKRSGGKYINVTQRPEVRKRNSFVKSSVEYQNRLKQNELKRSKGKYCHPSQRAETRRLMYNSRHQRYEVVYRDYTWKVQGYEDIALSCMIKNLKVKPKWIKSVPLTFSFKYRKNKKATSFSRYIPDFLLETKKSKVYVEVKSSWTAGLKKNGQGNISSILKRKLKAVLKKGFPCLLLVIKSNDNSPKGNKFRNGTILNFILCSGINSSLELRSDIKNLKSELKELLRLN
jgi:predicted nuclease of restriction endonuclease-like RecB superfamily